MHVNRTRIILIVMIIATVVLGGAAIFIGWRLQNQVNTNSFAGSACTGYSFKYPERYCSDFKNGTTCCKSCVREVYQNSGGEYCRNDVGQCQDENGGCAGTPPAPTGCGSNRILESCVKYSCDSSKGKYVCYDKVCKNNTETFDIGTPTQEACSSGTGDLVPPTQCNRNGVKDNGETGIDCGGGSCGACVVSAGTPVPNPADKCTKPTGYDTPGRQYSCSCTASQLCDEGNGAKGCYYNCSYTSVTYDDCLTWYNATTLPNKCSQKDYTLSGGTKCYKYDFSECGGGTTPPPSSLTCYKCTDATTDGNACSTQTVTGSSCPSGWTTNSNCASQATGGSCSTTTTQNTCYKCTDAEDDGNTCQTQTTTGTCASLGAGWTSNSSCATAATGGSCAVGIQAKVSGRVYCQDPGGIIIPIPNTVVAITKGSTTVNATTDSDGFYLSSAISLPSAGDKVAVDIGSLPSTFNNGLNTSQLTGKSALNCATSSKLAGCSTGVASNYYCDNVTTKGSYANCKLTTAGDSTSGHGYFDFKYTNCSAAVPSCGNSVVDAGEACDPVGTVGQCTNGGKCQTGCACSTCNSACSTNDDCPDGLICSGNSCRNPSNTSAIDCKVRVVPSTGILDGNYLLIFTSFIFMVLGLLVIRNQGAITLMTNVAISLFGTNILRYVDPAGAKRYYEKNILNKQKHEAE